MGSLLPNFDVVILEACRIEDSDAHRKSISCTYIPTYRFTHIYRYVLHILQQYLGKTLISLDYILI